MQRVATATATELLKLKPVRRGLLVLRRHVIALLTIRALQNDVVSSAFRHFVPLSIRCSSFVVRGRLFQRTTNNDQRIFLFNYFRYRSCSDRATAFADSEP